MRIAFATSYRPEAANGVHVVAAQLGQSLVSAGVEVEFWHFRRDRDQVFERVESSGVTVVDLPQRAIPGTSSLPHLRFTSPVSKAWLASNAGRVDGLHFHSIFQPEAWFLARTTTIPYCISPHGGYAMSSWRTVLKRPLWAALEKPLLERARFVIAVSEGDKASVLRFDRDATVFVVPTGIDIPFVEPSPPPPDGPWLFLGRLDVKTKGLDLLVEGYASATRRRDLPHLIIRGPDFRNGRRQIEAMVAQHGLQEKVTVGDGVFGPAKGALLEGSSLCIHTSRSEGLPMGLLEALAAGRPLAVTPGTNLAEAVRTAQAGYVIAEPTVDAVASSFVRIADAPYEETVDRGRRALGLARSTYSRERSAVSVANLYSTFFR